MLVYKHCSTRLSDSNIVFYFDPRAFNKIIICLQEKFGSAVESTLAGHKVKAAEVPSTHFLQSQRKLIQIVSSSRFLTFLNVFTQHFVNHETCFARPKPFFRQSFVGSRFTSFQSTTIRGGPGSRQNFNFSN